MNKLIDEARHIPVRDPVPSASVNPVTLPAPDRGLPIELRIAAPMEGHDLPIVLLSHGHGPSLYLPSKDGYGPLREFYAQHGFAVIQPTHLSSEVGGLDTEDPDDPLFWRSRVEDMKRILDSLDEIEAQAPPIAGRLDRDRVAAVGHSLGAQTVGMLLGSRLTDPNDPNATDVDLSEPRIEAGVMLSAPGNGGDDLSENARENYSFLNPDYSHLTTQTLVVVGDEDTSPHLTVRGAEWHADAYHHSPGADALLTLSGGTHGLGGIAGYDAKETDDEDPDRLAVTQRMTQAYLRSALYADGPAWSEACEALQEHASSQGRIESK